MPKVIKLGGSLISDVSTLTHCLQNIKNHSQENIVIVPGGGVFADQVRHTQKQWGFDEQTAHDMALLAMQQMALLFKSINNSFIIADTVFAVQQAWHKHAVVIWSPGIKELYASSVKASWDVSSDSLAAWLANQLNIQELILVKSAVIPLSYNIQALQKQGVIDKAFADFIKNASYKISIINKQMINEVLCH